MSSRQAASSASGHGRWFNPKWNPMGGRGSRERRTAARAAAREALLVHDTTLMMEAGDPAAISQQAASSQADSWQAGDTVFPGQAEDTVISEQAEDTVIAEEDQDTVISTDDVDRRPRTQSERSHRAPAHVDLVERPATAPDSTPKKLKLETTSDAILTVQLQNVFVSESHQVIEPHHVQYEYHEATAVVEGHHVQYGHHGSTAFNEGQTWFQPAQPAVWPASPSTSEAIIRHREAIAFLTGLDAGRRGL